MAGYKPVRVAKRGKNYQISYYDLRGIRRRLSAGPDSSHAQRVAIRFEDWLLDGKDPERELEKHQQQAQARSMTIEEFFPTFMSRHGSQRSVGMQKSYEDSLNNICRCPALASLGLSEITKSIVIDYMHERMRTDGVKAATVNKDAAFIKCMMSRAVEWDILEHNPLQRMKLFKEEGKRDIYLSLEEAKALIDELPHPVADIVEFAIYTGFRKENILSLKIEACRMHREQDIGEVELLVKGGRREQFPLGTLAVEVIRRAMGKRKKGYVFINPRTKTRYSCVHKSFDRAVEKLGLKAGNGTKLRFHDLRHVFATWLANAGVSLDSLRILLGHKDRATTDRYTTVSTLGVGTFLSRLPNIREGEQKENPGATATRVKQAGTI